jgi:nesprin-1
LIKAKEKEVEKIEQNGLALIQNKKEEVSAIVMGTLQELSQAWANLDHMVMLPWGPRLLANPCQNSGFQFS